MLPEVGVFAHAIKENDVWMYPYFLLRTRDIDVHLSSSRGEHLGGNHIDGVAFGETIEKTSNPQRNQPLRTRKGATLPSQWGVHETGGIVLFRWDVHERDSVFLSNGMVFL